MKKNLNKILMCSTLLLFTYGIYVNSLYIKLLSIMLLIFSVQYYYMSNRIRNIIIILFNLLIFLFLIGRPAVASLKGWNWWYAGENYNHIALNLIFLSIACIFLGHKIVARFNYNKILKEKVFFSVDQIKVLEYMFIITVLIKLIAGIINYILLRNMNYVDLYTSGTKGLPSSIVMLGDISIYLIYILILAKIEKKKFLIYSFFYIVALFPNLLQGARNEISLFLLFIFIILILQYDYLSSKTLTEINKIKLLKFILVIISIVFLLSTVDRLREKKDNSGDFVLNFIYLQGTTYDTLIQGLKYEEMLPKRKKINYTMNGIVSGYEQNPIVRKIFVKKKNEPGNNIFKATNGSSLAHQLSYVALGKDSYLKGHGRGSSYILENFLDYSYTGVIYISLLLGMLLTILPDIYRVNKIVGVISIGIMHNIFLLPRSETTGFIGFVFDVKLWITIIMITVCWYFMKFDLIKEYINKFEKKWEVSALNSKFFSKFRLVTIKDALALLFIFPICYIVSLFYKKRHKNMILICENENEARDNGYWLFKYIRENHPEEQIVYVINSGSPDYLKVKDLGETIEYSSFKHWIYYLSAGINVSTQKGGKPNAAVFYLLEVYGILKNKRIFLQHGITKDNAHWLYYKNTKMTGFVCGAKPEFDDIKEKYGYPEGAVRYLGFPRFDQLHNIEVNKKTILLMPSWREWLNLNTSARDKFNEGDCFTDSEYYIKWNDFLNDERLKLFLEKEGLTLIFYPHRNFQDNIYKFNKSSDNIVFANWKDYDIQQLLKESAVLITDYSSVFMDFSYMRKPSLYYQFDYEKFREGQYEAGYFDYRDGFGKVFKEKDKLIIELEKMYYNNFVLSDEYKNKIDTFFPLYDRKNSERNYKFIKEVLEK